MNILQALLAWILGLALIAVFFRSLISTTLFNRYRRDGIGHAVTRIAWAAVPHGCIAQQRAGSD